MSSTLYQSVRQLDPECGATLADLKELHVDRAYICSEWFQKAESGLEGGERTDAKANSGSDPG